MKSLQYKTVYNINNLIGLLFISIGVGLFDFRYGLIVAGVLFVGINIFNSIMIKAD